MEQERPKRKQIPFKIKKAIIARQNGICAKDGCSNTVCWKPNSNTIFDHWPPIRMREVNQEGTDYIPPQHDMDHIQALCRNCDDRKTRTTGATCANSDIHKIRKSMRIGKGAMSVNKPVLGKQKDQKPKYSWPSRPFNRSKKT